jgi:hypothetical protein
MKKFDIPSYFLFGAAVGTFLTFALSSQPFLTDIYLVGFCAIAGAITTIFIDYLIAPKQIFGFWQTVLKRLSETRFKELAKPLGLCIYCMNVYVFTACFLVLYMKTDISWWYFIPSAGFSHVALAYIDRKINS